MPNMHALALVGPHENRALLTSSYDMAVGLANIGCETEVLDLTQPDGFARLDAAMHSGTIDFAFGLQGIGSCLAAQDTISIWTHARTPFIGLHFDHPCHNPLNHINASPFVGNLYFFPSFLRDKNTYMPSDQLSSYAETGFLAPPPRGEIAFRDRPIRLLFLKSGAALDSLYAEVQTLPAEIQNGLCAIIENAAADPNQSLAAQVETLFDSLGADRKRFPLQFWNIVRLADLTIRRKRAIDFVNWLKFQDGAVIIGDGWDFIDKTDARAEFRPAIPMEEAVKLYGQTQFVCNTNPYGPDIIHERVVLALAAGTCVLSDDNAWLAEKLGETQALTRFAWNRDLDSQLGPVLADIAAAENAALHAHEKVDGLLGRSPAPAIVDFAQQVAAFAKTRLPA